MISVSRAVALPLVALAALTLASCTTEAETPTTDAPGVSAEAPQESTEAAPDGGEGGTGGACPAVPQEGFELFTSEIVASGPDEGAVFGDGSTLSFTFTEPIGGTADLDLFYVNEAGDAIQMGGLFLEDQGDNNWSTSNLVFTSDADGRPGYAFLGITSDADLTHEVVGAYCLALKVAP